MLPLSSRWMAVAAISSLLFCASAAAQDAGPRYARVFLRDKGVPFRYILPGDTLYQAATSWVTPRALARRAKVLPAARLLSTDDLPVVPVYLQQILQRGASVEQTSRWFNMVTITADSATLAAVATLPFVDSLVEIPRVIVSAYRREPLPRFVVGPDGGLQWGEESDCITDHYGVATFQNTFMGLDEAHRVGIAGDGVLVGVIDAGFDWRSHRALEGARILREYDFIYRDSNTADEAQDSLVGRAQESHGTLVLSVMAGTWADTLIGGAPRSAYMLAKTEDLRWERHVEEDNFVAGLEWLEAQGVEVTNTSLGYTAFDPPEAPHSRADLTGNTIIASRAVNRATALGVVSVLAAGNEGYPWAFLRVGTPAEADSAIAAAAVDSLGRVAAFSSRGFPSGRSLKPDLAGFGVGAWGANAAGTRALTRAQGTSLASPMVASVAAVVLSAAPELRPWELRDLLARSASGGGRRDTAVGYGIAHAGRALTLLATQRIVVGVPAVSLTEKELSIAAYVLRRRADDPEVSLEREPYDSLLRIDVASTRTGLAYTSYAAQPVEGIARWFFPSAPLGLAAGDSVVITISDRRPSTLIGANPSRVLRRSAHRFDGSTLESPSTLCALPALAAQADEATILAWPNPTQDRTTLSFTLQSDADVTLLLYNAIGEEVARFIDRQPLKAGSYAWPIALHGLPPGAYYPQMRAGDASANGSLIYLP